jgi:hypothetical protein
MKYFLRCLAAERLKTKRTIYLLGVFALPTILSLFNFLLIAGIAGQEGYYAGDRQWVSYEHNTITFGALLVYPILIVLVTSFITHQEHDTGSWRRLMCLPMPREALYLAKLSMSTILVLLGCLIMWLENIVWGWLLSVLRPEMGLVLTKITPLDMLVPFLFIFLLALLILSLHFWFAVQVHNFVVSIGLGMALIMMGMFLRELSFFNVAFPWALPVLVYDAPDVATLIGGLLYSMIGGLVCTFAGCWSFVRRDVLA